MSRDTQISENVVDSNNLEDLKSNLLLAIELFNNDDFRVWKKLSHRNPTENYPGDLQEDTEQYRERKNFLSSALAELKEELDGHMEFEEFLVSLNQYKDSLDKSPSFFDRIDDEFFQSVAALSVTSSSSGTPATSDSEGDCSENEIGFSSSLGMRTKKSKIEDELNYQSQQVLVNNARENCAKNCLEKIFSEIANRAKVGSSNPWQLKYGGGRNMRELLGRHFPNDQFKKVPNYAASILEKIGPLMALNGENYAISWVGSLKEVHSDLSSQKSHKIGLFSCRTQDSQDFIHQKLKELESALKTINQLSELMRKNQARDIVTKNKTNGIHAEAPRDWTP